MQKIGFIQQIMVQLPGTSKLCKLKMKRTLHFYMMDKDNLMDKKSADLERANRFFTEFIVLVDYEISKSYKARYL